MLFCSRLIWLEKATFHLKVFTSLNHSWLNQNVEFLHFITSSCHLPDQFNFFCRPTVSKHDKNWEFSVPKVGIYVLLLVFFFLVGVGVGGGGQSNFDQTSLECSMAGWGWHCGDQRSLQALIWKELGPQSMALCLSLVASLCRTSHPYCTATVVWHRLGMHSHRSIQPFILMCPTQLPTH